MTCVNTEKLTEWANNSMICHRPILYCEFGNIIALLTKRFTVSNNKFIDCCIIYNHPELLYNTIYLDKYAHTWYKSEIRMVVLKDINGKLEE